MTKIVPTSTAMCYRTLYIATDICPPPKPRLAAVVCHLVGASPVNATDTPAQ
jgi:hypothetical protein